MFQIRYVPYWTGALVIVLAGLTLIGWVFDIEILKTTLPGFVSMKANTAICLALAGWALILQGGAEPVPARHARLARILAVLVVLAGLLTLAEYSFNLNLGMDEL